MAKKVAPVAAGKVASAPAVAAVAVPVLKSKPADPVAAAPAVEKSEVKGSGRVTKAPAKVSTEQIAERAYYIFAGRGFSPGDPQADWLEAERQLKAGL